MRLLGPPGSFGNEGISSLASWALSLYRCYLCVLCDLCGYIVYFLVLLLPAAGGEKNGPGRAKMDSCVSHFNEFGRGTGWPEEVMICDVTMRDGEQTPGVAFSLDEKIELARRLDQMGVPQIQVGLPGRSRAARLEAEKICRVEVASQKELMTRNTYEG